MLPSDPLEQIREVDRRIKDAPPAVYAILATDKLTSDIKRQWDARGRLLLWVPRHLIERLPKRGEYRGIDVRELPGGDVSKLAAIPVFNVD